MLPDKHIKQHRGKHLFLKAVMLRKYSKFKGWVSELKKRIHFIIHRLLSSLYTFFFNLIIVHFHCVLPEKNPVIFPSKTILLRKPYFWYTLQGEKKHSCLRTFFKKLFIL